MMNSQPRRLAGSGPAQCEIPMLEQEGQSPKRRMVQCEKLLLEVALVIMPVQGPSDRKQILGDMLLKGVCCS